MGGIWLMLLMFGFSMNFHPDQFLGPTLIALRHPISAFVFAAFAYNRWYLVRLLRSAYGQGARRVFFVDA